MGEDKMLMGVQFFSAQKLSEGFFRIAAPGGAMTMGRLTGGATSAAPFGKETSTLPRYFIFTPDA